MNIQKRMEILTKNLNDKDGTWARNIDFWEWNSGVGVFGVKEAYEATGEAFFESFLKEWFDRNLETRNEGCVNCVIPIVSLFPLYRKDKKPQYKEAFDKYSHWCVTESLKTENGGISHFWRNSGVDGIENQLWADSVFMAVMFMFEYAAITNDKELFEKAIEQLDIHITCLFDEKLKLFYHGYDCRLKKHLGQFWGRGNGWVVATLAKVIPLMEKAGYNTDKFKKIFADVMEMAYSCRSENGKLRTIITDGEAYEEMSGTMLFGYAAIKGVKAGILPEKYIEWAKIIYDTIEYDSDGSVKYMSAGTNPDSREVYLSKPFMVTCYNIGISLAFLSAVYSLN